MTAFVGVDACESGWIAVDVGENIEIIQEDEFKQIYNCVDDDGVVLVDIPIGLPEEGRRVCDEDARDLLGCRGSSVFYVPTKGIVDDFEEYSKANEESKARTGNGISTQVWSITPKIKEVNEFVRNGYDGAEIHETHPEVCFYGLDGRPMAYSKKDERGVELRKSVLSVYEEDLGFSVEEVVCDATDWKGVSEDDALDALAAAVTAYRGDKMEYEVLGGKGKPPMEIRYVEDSEYGD